MSRVPTIADVQRKAADTAFNRRHVVNVLRGLLAEVIVELALEGEWTRPTSDYAGWDLEHGDGLKLEVKQSAAWQTWSSDGQPSVCSFDVASKTGRWEGGKVWVPEPGRQAHLYVFAHHPVADDTADHRDPSQWHFYVVPTRSLPNVRRLSLKRLQALSTPVTFENLADTVRSVAVTIQR